MTRRAEWSQGAGRALLIGSAFGLAREAEEVKEILEAERFDRILLGVPAEDLGAVKGSDAIPPTEAEWDLGELEEVYLDRLARFGPTRIPPGEPYHAARSARERGVPIEAIDLPDAAHTEIYAKHVGTLEHIGKSRRQRKLAAEAEGAKDLEAFVRAWDRAFFPTRGLRRVEEERVRHMAERIRQAVRLGGRTLALLPLERLEEVLTALKESAATPPQGQNPY